MGVERVGPEAAVVLVVADDADRHRFACDSLAGGYRVESAHDGLSGLAAAEALRPSLVVCDVALAGGSAEELVRAIRSSPALATTPVLLLTTRADAELRQTVLRAGADDYVTAPFTPEELQARSDNLLRLRRLEQGRGQARAILESAPDATLVVDRDGRVLQLNRQAEAAFGYPAAELLGQRVEMLLPEGSREVHPGLRQAFAQHPRPRTMGSGLELSARRKDGTLLPVDVSLSPVETPDGTCFIAAIRDVSTQRQVQERLRHLALHDALTGLPNRPLLLDRLGQSLATLGRVPGCVAVFFVDLDRFKQVNDQHGHEVGDQVLVHVAARLLGAVRPQDTVARLGGDEFAVACSGLTDELEAVVLAERVDQALRTPISLGPLRIHPTASLGVALARDASAEPEELLRNADTAMYRAKQRGRDRVEVFDEALGRLAALHFQTEAMLRAAIDDDQLLLRYQPVVDLASGQVTGVEALLRIAHPQRGLLEPEGFIETAEETGQIVPMGRWVVREACRQLAAWQRQGHRLQVSVNLSGRQVNHVDLEELVLDAARDAGADPALLCVEVTETALMEATPAILSSFDALKAAGVSLAIDDFGTGWSSLTYLKRLPVDVIKIDKSFTDGLGVLVDDTAIVTSLVTLGHALGCAVTIEGVETRHQLEHALDLRCDRAQGFLFGRPQTAQEVLALATGPPLALPRPRAR
jgi:diguanylate cyclase (GGDEF)-like protein/PAS domain S-box-containing protein